MKCDIIIPVWNQLQFTKRCIESIQKSTGYPYHLILIDNCSDIETRDYLKILAESNDNITLIKNEKNLGFIKAANQGLKVSNSSYVCLMNNDTIATDGWLSKMISIAEGYSNIGLINPKSESPRELSLDEYSKKLAQNKGQYMETNQCMGFCMLIKREVIQKIGYLDEAYGIGGFDDADFSKRTQLAGYKCVCAKDAYVYHDWHTSFKKAGNREELVKKNERLFFDKWGKYLRVGYPIAYNGKNEDFYIDINTSLGMAREWNWVHAWLNANKALKDQLDSLNLPEHQSLRIFRLSGIKFIFYLEVLFRLIERRLKRKKPFDVVMVSDKRMLKFLSRFKGLFLVPLFFIGRDEFQYGTNMEESWRMRARNIVEHIKKGRKL